MFSKFKKMSNFFNSPIVIGDMKFLLFPKKFDSQPKFRLV